MTQNTLRNRDQSRTVELVLSQIAGAWLTKGQRTKDKGQRTKDPALLTTFTFAARGFGLLILIVRFRANVSHNQILPDLQRIVCCILPVERNKN